MKGTKLVAMEGPRILGLIHWVNTHDCQFSGLEKLKMTPAMIRGFGPHFAMRISKWLFFWSKHDPEDPHPHLGPIGIEPSALGRVSAGN